MPASRVTSRRLSAPKLRSSRSLSEAAMIERRVASLRSSRVTLIRDDELDRRERDVGVRLFTAVKRNTIRHFPLTWRWFTNHCVHMFTQMLDLLTGPHGVARYTELVSPTWSRRDARAKVVSVQRRTPRSVTLLLEPNKAFAGFKAGQHINLTVEIDGRRRTRCYSPASAEGSPLIELTIGLHDGGLVSTHLFRHARPGVVVGLDSVGGDFVLSDDRPRRILFVSGGSGITPVMSMLRTLRGESYDGELAFVNYARSAAEACYRDELAT